jgi:hypothetical protein
LKIEIEIEIAFIGLSVPDGPAGNLPPQGHPPFFQPFQ